jgi:hypothetical protein
MKVLHCKILFYVTTTEEINYLSSSRSDEKTGSDLKCAIEVPDPNICFGVHVFEDCELHPRARLSPTRLAPALYIYSILIPILIYSKLLLLFDIAD